MADNRVILSWMGSSPKDKIVNLILIAIFLVALYFGIRYLYGVIKSTFTTAKKELQEDIESGGKLTFSESEYRSMADDLEQAMKGIGTDEDTVYSVFYKVATKADVLKLIVEFGVRKGEDLSQWLRKDLSISEIKKVNSILAQKGIDYHI
jgi:uncharacterized protein YpmB